jgi:hypothetical protein
LRPRASNRSRREEQTAKALSDDLAGSTGSQGACTQAFSSLPDINTPLPLQTTINLAPVAVAFAVRSGDLAQLAQLGAKVPSRFVAAVLVDQGVG